MKGSRKRAEVQEALSEVNSNVGGLEGKVELLERDVAQVKDKVSNDPLPALIEEQKQREKDIYQYIEGQMARFGLQQEDIARCVRGVPVTLGWRRRSTRSRRRSKCAR